MHAMILAAGLGTRLRPFSLVRPKPLFPVLDLPLLLLTIRGLRRAGFNRLVINAHHLAAQFVALLKDEENIAVQQEAGVLGTGGGLRKAAPRFRDEPVLVTNGDIYHTMDLGGIYQRHCAAGAAVTMVLHDYPRFNNVVLDETSGVAGFGADCRARQGGLTLLAFTGIHVIGPTALRFIAKSKFSSIIDCYRAWLAAGNNIRAEVVRDSFWSDIGTPADYLALHGGLLKGDVPRLPWFDIKSPAGPFYVGPGAAIGKDVRMTDWVCVGSGARVGAGANLAGTVVWDGATVAAGADIHNTIIYK